MDGAEFQARRGHRLEPSGHPQGVSCDAHGPALGPIRLLAKTDTGFVPHPIGELNDVFSRTFGRPMDCSSLLPGLKSVAGALNASDLPRAMIATQLLHLPYLDEAEAARAADAAALSKASPNDPKHPGWPKDTPDSLGAKFEPKYGDLDTEARRIVVKRVLRLIIRLTIRFGL